jgi:hypothetical protein
VQRRFPVACAHRVEAFGIDVAFEETVPIWAGVGAVQGKSDFYLAVGEAVVFPAVLKQDGYRSYISHKTNRIFEVIQASEALLRTRAGFAAKRVESAVRVFAVNLRNVSKL